MKHLDLTEVDCRRFITQRREISFGNRRDQRQCRCSVAMMSSPTGGRPPLLYEMDTLLMFRILIGVARGCSGCTCTPQGGEKNFSGIYRKMCKCTPQDTKCTSPANARVKFLGQYAGWLRLEVYLDAILRATTKKRSTNFGGKRAPRQNSGYAYAYTLVQFLCQAPSTSIFTTTSLDRC